MRPLFRRAEVFSCGLVGQLLCLAALGDSPAPLAAQATLGHSPNIRAPWTLAPGQGAFSFTHRFEVISGGDELINLPTFSLGFRASLAVLARGRTSPPTARSFPRGSAATRRNSGSDGRWCAPARVGAEALVAYNSAARGFDAALTARVTVGPVSLLAEARGFQDALGTGEARGAGALGAVIRLTPYLELSADAGKMFGMDSLSTIWSAGVAMAIPGSPHTLSLAGHQRRRRDAAGSVAPQGAGTGEGALRLRLHPAARLAAAMGQDFPGRLRVRGDPASGDTAQVELKLIALSPREIRVRAGQAVEWTNRDPLVHTVTSDDGVWDSGELKEGRRFVQVFTRAGTLSLPLQPASADDRCGDRGAVRWDPVHIADSGQGINTCCTDTDIYGTLHTIREYNLNLSGSCGSASP